MDASLENKEKYRNTFTNIKYLRTYNQQLEANNAMDDSLFQKLWTEWLFELDPNANLIDECGGLNSMHMYGILLARALYYQDKKKHSRTENPECVKSYTEYSIEELLPESEEIHVYDKPLNALTLREYKDTVEALQLHFKQVLENDGLPNLQGTCMQLFIQFGMFANYAMSDEIMDENSICATIPGQDPRDCYFIMTCKALRTFVDIFFVFFRAIYLFKKTKILQLCNEDNSESVFLFDKYKNKNPANETHDPPHIYCNHADTFAKLIQNFHVVSVDVCVCIHM